MISPLPQTVTPREALDRSAHDLFLIYGTLLISNVGLKMTGRLDFTWWAVVSPVGMFAISLLAVAVVAALGRYAQAA